MAGNTRDLSKFGYRELAEAGRLLSTLKTSNDKTKLLAEGVSVEFNPMSGMVFLVDEDFNVAVMEDDKLVDFVSCPECGYEGTLDDFQCDKKNGNTDDCCDKFFSEVFELKIDEKEDSE